ncbi:Signal recognition particle protein [bacterium HR33]|nr:Signal recognition particle protein [bacterium HR33]
MFAALSERLTGLLRRLSSRGVLTEEDVREGLREIRRVLLEADVGYEIARDFTERVAERAVGVVRLKQVNPGQQLVKIVHDELAALLGERQAPLQFSPLPPAVFLLVGLQGSGKTTTAAKLAARLKRENKPPFLVAADVKRPAAEEQLRQLASRIQVPCFGPADYAALRGGSGVEPDAVGLVRTAVERAKRERAAVVIVDTAGRMQIDREMMEELRRIKEAVEPREILLVADAMTGQDAVRIARGFHESVGVTGVILTKLDGDARGGAALSIYGATGAPIKFAGTGERLDALEAFDPVRMAGRILQQGDVVALVEKVERAVDREEAVRLSRRAVSKKGMDLTDFLSALKQVQSLGPLESVLGLLPGIGARVGRDLKLDPKRLKHLEAIVLSMTPEERSRPEIINGSRRARIARGSGRPVQEVNALLKQFEQMRKLMKGMGRLQRKRIR